MENIVRAVFITHPSTSIQSSKSEAFQVTLIAVI